MRLAEGSSFKIVSLGRLDVFEISIKIERLVEVSNAEFSSRAGETQVLKVSLVDGDHVLSDHTIRIGDLRGDSRSARQRREFSLSSGDMRLNVRVELAKVVGGW